MDLKKLTDAVDELEKQEVDTETVEDKAAQMINDFAAKSAAAVADALAKSEATGQAAIDVAVAAINDTKAKFLASSTKLDAAENPPAPTPVP